MPGFDGNGPLDAGPMTGGARGFCNRAEEGYAGPPGFRGMMAFGRGFRKGLGLRRGFGGFRGKGFGPYSPGNFLSAKEELKLLKEQAESVKSTLDSLTKRISEIER